jgi:hypothetical protein
VFLRLPIVEHFNAISFERVVGGPNCAGVIPIGASIVACAPRSCDCPAIVAKPQTFRDLCEVGRAANAQTRASGSCFKRGITGGPRQSMVSDFFNFSSKSVLEYERIIANDGALSN